VDIGQPTVRHGTGRNSAVTAQRVCAIDPVHPVNEPGCPPPARDMPGTRSVLGVDLYRVFDRVARPI